MDNFNFLRKWQRMQYGPEYDELIQIDTAWVCFTKTNSSEMANYALVKELPENEMLENIENYYMSKKRKSTIYFEKSKQKDFGYKRKWEDSWMFYEDSVVNDKDFEKVKIVGNENDLEIFLDTFNKCYLKDDPQNPYGEVKEYLINSHKAWKKYRERLNYYVVFDNGEPVATAALQNFEGLGYVSCVGSLKKVRGKGFGKLATLFAISESLKNGNSVNCLATEEGTYPNEFYKRIGFQTRFTAEGWTRD